MSTIFRFRTQPQILADMFASARGLLGDDVSLLLGGFLEAIFETCALQDADQYVQIQRLLDLFALDECRGDDLDRRALDYGAAFYSALRRKAAQTSLAYIAVSDGTLLVKTTIGVAVSSGSSTFTVSTGFGANFPTSGAVVLERGTPREERIVYTRAADTFTVVTSTTPANTTGTVLLFSHGIGGEVLKAAIQSTLAGSTLIGATTITLATGTGAAWPASGTVVINRAQGTQERKAFTRSGDVLTVPALTNAHAAGEYAILSTVGSDRSIPIGSACYVPATLATKQILFRTKAAGTLYDGDFVSGLIQVESDAVGSQTLVGSNTIVSWSSAPFSGATVTNPVAATRGADREDDDPYRARIKAFIQSLSIGTALSIKQKITGVTDQTTNQQVAFAQVVEPVLPGVSVLYISDGTSVFQLQQTQLNGREVIINAANAGDKRGRLKNYAPFAVVSSPTNQVTPRLFKSSLSGTSTLVGSNFLEDSSKNMTVNQYTGFWLKASDGQFYQVASNTAIRFVLSGSGATPAVGAYAIFDFTANPLVPANTSPLPVGADYAFNESTGDLELAVPLSANDSLVAASDNALAGIGAYTYTYGLGATVQRTVNGDPTDFDDFPGLKATGTKVLVTAPLVVAPTFVLQVVPQQNVTVAQLAPVVQNIVQAYVNSLGIGDQIVLSEIIKRVKALPGVFDVILISPTANVPVPQGQLARIASSNVQLA